jgi:hypothetical protein
MRLRFGLFAAVAGVAVAGAAAAAPGIEIRDAVARVTVIPEDRADVKVEMLTTNRELPLEVRQSGGATVIDGHLEHRIGDCHTRGDHPSTYIRGVGRVDYKDMPQVVIHAPKAVAVEASGAVFGAIGRSDSLDLADSGCDAWTVADVAGDATLRESGAGAVRMGKAGRLDVRLSGAASIHATDVRALDAKLSGVGGVTVNSLAGPMQAHVSGVGNVKVLDGRATTVRASVSGMGGVNFGGQADSLDAQISGLGGIRVKSVTGQVMKSVSGAGHVTIG